MNTTARLLILSCLRNSFSSSQIIQFVKNALPDRCPCDRTIYYWIKKFRSGETSIDDNERSGRPEIPKLKKRIGRMLRQNKFISARMIGKKTKTSHVTILKKLKNQMKLRNLKTRVVPHPLNPRFLNRRAELSKELYEQLEKLKPVDIITSDESWFYFSYHHKAMWVKDKNEVLEVESRFQNSKKVMICIFWSFGNLLMIRILPEGTTYDTNYVLQTLIPDLEEVASSIRPVTGLKSYTIHWDNARPHRSNATTNAIKEKFKGSLIHPPYSPDLAPSDFFLFGYLKHELQGKVINDENDLLQELETAFKKIKKQKKRGEKHNGIGKTHSRAAHVGGTVDHGQS